MKKAVPTLVIIARLSFLKYDCAFI